MKTGRTGVAEWVKQRLINAKGQPLTAKQLHAGIRKVDDMRKVTLKSLRESLSRMNAKGEILYGGAGARKLGEEGGYRIEWTPPKIGRPVGSKNRAPRCYYCGHKIENWTLNQAGHVIPHICRTCQRVQSQVIYALTRLEHGGADAILMEVLVRQAVVEKQGARTADITREVLAELKRLNVNIDLIPKEPRKAR